LIDQPFLGEVRDVVQLALTPTFSSSKWNKKL